MVHIPGHVRGYPTWGPEYEDPRWNIDETFIGSLLPWYAYHPARLLMGQVGEVWQLPEIVVQGQRYKYAGDPAVFNPVLPTGMSEYAFQGASPVSPVKVKVGQQVGQSSDKERRPGPGGSRPGPEVLGEWYLGFWE